MMLVEPVFRVLLRMHWTVLLPPPEQPFWTSDAGVMVLAVDRGRLIVGGGIGLPGADVFVPLARDFALHATFRPGPTIREVDPPEHAALRRWTAFYADRFVFSPVAFDPDDPIVTTASRQPPRQRIDEWAAREQWRRLLHPLVHEQSRSRGRG